MTKNNRLIWGLLALVLSSNVFADGDIPINNSGSLLVSACREVIEIYDKRGKAELLAGQRTSLNEGIKAGYCIGATMQFLVHNHGCSSYTSSWYQLAERIAHSNLTESQLKYKNSSSILKAAYCGT
ncbi:hypothetical protein [Marinomonas sp. FW-1]|uniref:hypothetical protein n=1 Tax=Marinomonas sp. FW-1 TaxID=2071621 RepID=UPI0010BFEFB6|nr:hypothetical protein [Marinomonas sp. FW-1]